jgi:hypothetical protein
MKGGAMDKLLSVLKDQQICYYPSAGKDYRDMICIRKENLEPEYRKKYIQASLFLHVDCNPQESNLTFEPGQVLHDDTKGKITVKTVQQVTTLNLPLSNETGDTPEESADYGKCFLMDVDVEFNLKKGKKLEQTKLLYCFVDDEVFNVKVLSENKIELIYLCLSGNVYPFCGTEAIWAWLSESQARIKAKSTISKITLWKGPKIEVKQQTIQ